MSLQTEYEFNLPKGYIDEAGVIHKNGIMRLATAMDEIQASNHPKVKACPEYMPVIVLSKVVRRLGTLTVVTPQIIEGLFSADMNYLQNMYQTVNDIDGPQIHVTCPHCGKEFTEPINFLG